MVYVIRAVIYYNRSRIQYENTTIIITGKKAKIHTGNFSI